MTTVKELQAMTKRVKDAEAAKEIAAAEKKAKDQKASDAAAKKRAHDDIAFILDSAKVWAARGKESFDYLIANYTVDRSDFVRADTIIDLLKKRGLKAERNFRSSSPGSDECPLEVHEWLAVRVSW